MGIRAANSNNPMHNALRNYSITKVQQRMMEMKIKEFREKMTAEQIEMLYERSFTIKTMPKKKVRANADKVVDRYTFRDWR